MTPTYGLVIPTYNRCQLLIETVESALAQSKPFDEIIVVDDGSTDETVDQLQREFKSVNVIAKQRGGVQAARNVGIERLSSTWAVLCDSDDMLNSRYLERAAHHIQEAGQIEAAYSNFTEFGESRSASSLIDKFSQAPSGYFADFCKFKGGYVCGGASDALKLLAFQPLFASGLCIRRDAFNRIGPFDERLRGIGSEDLEFTLRVVANSRVVLLADPLVRIRKHSGNDSADLFRQLLGEAEVLRLVGSEHPWATDHRTAILTEAEARALDAMRFAFHYRDWAAVATATTGMSLSSLSVYDRMRVWLAQTNPSIQYIADRMLSLRQLMRW
jgi:glycosyltransferase involved in cell wall biosynthesis